MHLRHEAVLLRIFPGEADRWHHQPLRETIVRKAREMHLDGATVLALGILFADFNVRLGVFVAVTAVMLWFMRRWTQCFIERELGQKARYGGRVFRPLWRPPLAWWLRLCGFGSAWS